ncbi:MAG: oligosaccharide flippase family protein [Pseudomonadota bacterium]
MTTQAAEATDRKDIAKGAAQNLAGFIIRLGARLPFLLIVALLYGKARFGEYLFAVAVVETCLALISLGFRRSLFKFQDSGSGADGCLDFHQAIARSFLICLSLGTFVVALWYSLAAAFGLDNEVFRGVWYILPTILTYACTELLLTATRASRKMQYEVIAKSIVEPYSLSIFAAACYYLGHLDAGLYYAYWGMNLCILSYAIYAFTRLYSGIDLKRTFSGLWSASEIAKMLRFTLPTAMNDLIINTASRIDIYLIAGFVTPEAIGIYGIALQILTIVKKIRMSFDPVLDPIIASSIKRMDPKRVIAKLTDVGVMIFLIQMLIVGLLMYFGQLLLGLFDVSGDTAKATLIILVLSTVIHDSFGLSETLFIFKRPSINMMASGLGLISVVCAGLILIPRYGILGAALSMLTANVITTSFLLLLTRRFFRAIPMDVRVFVVCGVFGCHLLLMQLLNDLLDARATVVGPLSLVIGFILYGLCFKWFNRAPVTVYKG